ncbi:hypothetical protein [Actinomadura fibrosa]|uniref:Uncharacterized protein n=1 Tax=Actinomadura fibrosa TaxID=111802 RepID=A0ABW2XUP2_9ACTN|nr:hypothetical protein [Actinomadura fibrosa]
MAHHPFLPSGHGDFIAELQRFRADCGDPPYPGVISNVERLETLYPLRHPRKTLPTTLSASAISQVFSGSRPRLPSAELLAVLVLAHLYCAVENGSVQGDPDTGAPRHWQEILQAWQARRRQAQLAQRPPSSDDQPPADHRPSPTVNTAPSGGRRADPVHPTEPELETLSAHGPYGAVLAERARDGDSHAIYQIAVILATNPYHAAGALAYLLDATAAGHLDAAELVPSPGQRVDHQRVRAHAGELARAAEARGDQAAAHAFRSCALQAELGETSAAAPEHDGSD